MKTVWLLHYDDYPESGGGFEDTVYESESVAVAHLKARYPSPPNKVRWSEKRDPKSGALTVIADFYEHVQHHHTQHQAEWSVVEAEFVTADTSEPSEDA